METLFLIDIKLVKKRKSLGDVLEIILLPLVSGNDIEKRWKTNANIHIYLMEDSDQYARWLPQPQTR